MSSFNAPPRNGLAIVLYDRPLLSDTFIGRHVLSKFQTFGIEKEVHTLPQYLREVAKWDFVGRWDTVLRRPNNVVMREIVGLGAAGLLSYLQPRRIGLILPCITAWLYFCIPRKTISVVRMECLGCDAMELGEEASDFMSVTNVPQPKVEGAPVITGTHQGGLVVTVRRKKRTPYAARVAQVARAQVGILRNTPENRLIYQKVILKTMEKDRLRYVDRDKLLPLAIGYCFVYTNEAREAAALWDSQESLGVK